MQVVFAVARCGDACMVRAVLASCVSVDNVHARGVSIHAVQDEDHSPGIVASAGYTMETSLGMMAAGDSVSGIIELLAGMPLPQQLVLEGMRQPFLFLEDDLP